MWKDTCRVLLFFLFLWLLLRYLPTIFLNCNVFQGVAEIVSLLSLQFYNLAKTFPRSINVLLKLYHCYPFMDKTGMV